MQGIARGHLQKLLTRPTMRGLTIASVSAAILAMVGAGCAIRCEKKQTQCRTECQRQYQLCQVSGNDEYYCRNLIGNCLVQCDYTKSTCHSYLREGVGF